MNNICYYISPIGAVFRIEDDNNSIKEVNFFYGQMPNEKITPSALGKETMKQLDEYFSKKRKVFDLPLDPDGSEFQKRVWSSLLDIPYGELRSYKDIAIASGCPKGARAVGNANNKNHICIIIPCHRCIASDGTIGGYDGGTDIKEKLLELEGAEYKKDMKL